MRHSTWRLEKASGALDSITSRCQRSSPISDTDRTLDTIKPVMSTKRGLIWNNLLIHDESWSSNITNGTHITISQALDTWGLLQLSPLALDFWPAFCGKTLHMYVQLTDQTPLPKLLTFLTLNVVLQCCHFDFVQRFSKTHAEHACLHFRNTKETKCKDVLFFLHHDSLCREF